MALERAARDAPELLAQAGLVRTPLIGSPGLSDEYGCEVRLKLECHQLTGSFKPRGAMVATHHARESDTIVTASAGNHGLGIAFACSLLGRSAEIFIPEATDASKVEALSCFGPEIQLRRVAGSYDDTEVAARRAADGSGRTFISSYNDPFVVAGQSTIAEEILTQWPAADAIIVPVGGGGLLSGVALASSARGGPAAWGVEPAASPAMGTSLRAGRITRIADGTSSAAEGLVGQLDADSITFAHIRDRAAGVMLASERDILGAVTRIYVDHAIVVEPSGAAALCGLQGVVESGARRIVCVLTGANIAGAAHFAIIADERERP